MLIGKPPCITPDDYRSLKCRIEEEARSKEMIKTTFPRKLLAQMLFLLPDPATDIRRPLCEGWAVPIERARGRDLGKEEC